MLKGLVNGYVATLRTTPTSRIAYITIKRAGKCRDRA